MKYTRIIKAEENFDVNSYVYKRLLKQDNEIDILNSLKEKGYNREEAMNIIYEQLKRFK